MLSRFFCITLAYLIISLSGCERQTQAGDMSDAGLPGEKALAAAWSMIGRPYHYTGGSPEGFDCSGLVAFCYHSAGFELPHSTAELKQAGRLVPLENMRKGDLLFFEENGKKYAHVGIYAGNNKFIHAARTGRSVRVDSLLNPYWQERFLDARRLKQP